MRVSGSKMSQDYEVEKILARRDNFGRTEYKIKWLNYPTTEATWEPEKHLTHCKEMLKRFNQTHGKNPDSAKANPAPKNNTAQRTLPAKTINHDNKFKKKKPLDDETEEDEDKQDEEPTHEEDATPSRHKRPLPSNLKQPPPLRKSVRNRGPVSRGYNQDTEEPDPEDEMEQEESQRPTGRGGPKGQVQTKVEVLGMMELENVKYFKIRESGKISCVTREDLLVKDAVSIVLFYERNMKLTNSPN